MTLNENKSEAPVSRDRCRINKVYAQSSCPNICRCVYSTQTRITQLLLLTNPSAHRAQVRQSISFQSLHLQQLGENVLHLNMCLQTIKTCQGPDAINTPLLPHNLFHGNIICSKFLTTKMVETRCTPRLCVSTRFSTASHHCRTCCYCMCRCSTRCSCCWSRSSGCRLLGCRMTGSCLSMCFCSCLARPASVALTPTVDVTLDANTNSNSYSVSVLDSSHTCKRGVLDTVSVVQSLFSVQTSVHHHPLLPKR